MSKTKSLFLVLTSAAVTACNTEPIPAAERDHSSSKVELKAPEAEFVLQSYVLPQGWRHMTAFIDPSGEQLVAAGGLGNGGPNPPTPMQRDVFTLDLKPAPEDRQWVLHQIPEAERTVTSPWFTSTRGFIELGGRYFLACDDTDTDTIYEYDPVAFRFARKTVSDLPEATRAGDCCAVGVTVTNSRDGNQRGEERIYIIGGRLASPQPTVRYYSVTHDRWEQVSDLNDARSHLACAPAVLHGQPYIYAIGGGDQTQGLALRSIEVYDVLADEWTNYPDYLPAGLTRIGVQNLNDKYLLLVGGDLNCAGGGAGNRCASDVPTRSFQVIDLTKGNKLTSAPACGLPLLNRGRATPATAVRKVSNLYELYVIGGRTPAGTGTAVEATTEVLTFDWRSLNQCE
jgi:hypothetical protein